MLLVAGSCIGAGMLALPILTGLTGFFPSLLMLIAAWAFMTFTGLLLIEVNGWFSKQINLLSMAEEALGPKGRLVAWISYLFLFYSLLVAYVVATGSVFSSITNGFVSPAQCATFFTLLFGILIYFGTRPVDLCNRFLMIGLIGTYFGMIALGLFHIDPQKLLHFAPNNMLLSLSVLITSFGFQNMIPSLTAYLDRDLQKVRLTVIGGSFIALAIYVIWSFLVLSVLDPETIEASFAKGEEATVALKAVLGNAWISHFAQGFAFFAIITSFLAQGLTLTHFLADGFHFTPTKKHLSWLVPLALAPPLLLGLFNPQILFKALGFAGGICAVVLFGFLPIAMVWVGRYVRRHPSAYHAWGGKKALLFAFAFSLFILIAEVSRLF